METEILQRLNHQRSGSKEKVRIVLSQAHFLSVFHLVLLLHLLNLWNLIVDLIDSSQYYILIDFKFLYLYSSEERDLQLIESHLYLDYDTELYLSHFQESSFFCNPSRFL